MEELLNQVETQLKATVSAKQGWSTVQYKEEVGYEMNPANGTKKPLVKLEVFLYGPDQPI